MVKVTRRSMFSHEEHTLELPTTPEKIAQWDEWGRRPGTPYVQDYFPELSKGHREFLLTGVTPEEWEAEFSEDDDFTELEDDRWPG